MSAFVLPAAAAALWAGILLWPGSWHAPWIALLLGIGSLLAAAWLAAAPSGGPSGVLAAAGLVTEAKSLAAVQPQPPRPGRAPPLAVAALAAAGLLAVGAGMEGARHERMLGSTLAQLAPAQVRVVATLRTDPSPGRYGWSAVADVVRVTGTGDLTLPRREPVWVRGSDDGPPGATRGDLVGMTGVLLRPSEGFREFLWSRGIAVELRAHVVERLGPAPNPMLRAALAARSTLSRSIRDLFEPREAGLLLGLSLGDDSGLDPEVERDFRATGLSHLLVVSGGNVAMVLAPVLALATALRVSGAARVGLGLGTVAFFVGMTGAEPSVLRAGLMAAIGLTGVLLGRARSTGATLGGAVFLLLLLDPVLARSVGFQLSVAATAGMVAMAGPIARSLRLLPRPIAVAAGATLAAQAAVSPLLLFYFGEVPLMTLVANVLAFPAVAPALLLGLGAAGLGAVSSSLGRGVATIADLPLRYLEAVADRLARAPIAWVTSGGGIEALLVGGVLVVALAWWLRSGRPPPRWSMAAAAVALPAFLLATALRAGPPGGLTVHFLDIGQGDAAAVVSPGGATVLVDGGPDPTLAATKLSALGVRRIDVLVASHAHADHVAGLPAVMARLRVGLVLEPGCPDDSPEYAAFLRAVADEGLPVDHPRAGDVVEVGDVRLEVLAPTECWTGTESDANNDSLVLRLEHRHGVVLFPGDAEEPSQEALVESGAPLEADVLKVPHHGGATSVPEFFGAVGAEVAVVSVGEGNEYGHPVPEVLADVRSTGAIVLRTDLAGDVTVTFGREGLLLASAA